MRKYKALYIVKGGKYFNDNSYLFLDGSSGMYGSSTTIAPTLFVDTTSVEEFIKHYSNGTVYEIHTLCKEN